MKKHNILAVLIPALLAAGAANAAEVYNKDGNKLDLYGRAVGLYYFSNGDENEGDRTYVRVGLKGESVINEQMTAYGQFERNIAAAAPESGVDADDGDVTRLAFAGIDMGEAGSLDFGRNYGIVYDAIGWTDMLPEFGGDSAAADTFMNGRSSSLLTYRNRNFFGLVDGLNFGLQFQGKNNRNDIIRSNGEGWGTSMTYVAPNGMGLSAAYSASNRTAAQKAGIYYPTASGPVVPSPTQAIAQGNKAESWAVAVKYDGGIATDDSANGLYLAAMYGETHNLSPMVNIAIEPSNDQVVTLNAFTNKARNTELVAQYQFDFGLRPSLSYIQSKGKDLDGIGDADLYKYVEIGATYAFNKNFLAYVDYRINQLSNKNVLNLPNDDTVATGFAFLF